MRLKLFAVKVLVGRSSADGATISSYCAAQGRVLAKLQALAIARGQSQAGSLRHVTQAGSLRHVG